MCDTIYKSKILETSFFWGKKLQNATLFTRNIITVLTVSLPCLKIRKVHTFVTFYRKILFARLQM